MTLDEAIYPYAGPCAFCGFRDKRHRLWDAVRENYRAGDSAESIADDYDLSVEAVRWIVAQRRFPRQRRGDIQS